MNWHYERNGVSVGPLTEAQLETARLGGEILAGCRVWREDWPAWKRAGDVWPAGPWQDGECLVVRMAAPVLPDCCFKCGAPPSRRIHKTLKWHHPLLYLAILVFIVPYILLGLIFTRSVKLEISLCSACDRRRVRNLAIGAAIFLTGCGLVGLGTFLMTDDETLSNASFIGAGLLLSASALWRWCTRVVAARKIDSYYAWILRSGTSVRSQLPQWTGG